MERKVSLKPVQPLAMVLREWTVDVSFRFKILCKVFVGLLWDAASILARCLDLYIWSKATYQYRLPGKNERLYQSGALHRIL